MHANAFGYGIKISDISKLYDYANRELANINFNEGFFEADFIVNGNCSYLSPMIIDLSNGKDFYGQDCPEPLIIIKNIVIDTSQIQFIGKNKDTLKFSYNGITYIKFKAAKLIEQFSQYDGKTIVTIAGKGNVNEWRGNITPQIFIEEAEIKQLSDYDF